MAVSSVKFQQTEVAGARVIARKAGTSERASAKRNRKGRSIKARETGQTSCYILEEHSNSDMKREARSVNEDPRGNALGPRNGTAGEERSSTYARSDDADEREKERGKRGGKGAKQRAGRELFLEHSRFHSLTSLSFFHLSRVERLGS